MSAGRGRTIWFVLAVVVLGCLVGGYILFGRSPPKRHVKVTFLSDPSGATLIAGGVKRGPTPTNILAVEGATIQYTVVPKEPYKSYDLYKSYTGKILADHDKTVSVWIPRTTAEEQKKQRDAYAKQQQQKAAAAAAAKAAQQRALEAQKLYYRVETECPDGADVTYSNANGDSTQQNNVTNSWYYWFYPRSGQFIYLSAQNQCGSGFVRVQLVKDGQVVRENTSTGGYVIATVSGRW